jgi:trans-aconitate methyltransferase
VTRPEVRVSPTWLDQREAADAAARAADLVEALRDRLPDGPLVVHDLGSGTGSTTRWLAPRLPGPQRWVLHDLDPDLLDLAGERTAGVRTADGSAPTCETRHADVTRLGAEALAGAGLVTCSALLDILTDEELRRLVAVCTAAACPALLTLTVVGRVELVPHDPLDAVVGASFDHHQRRPARGGRLLGPDALDAATTLFREAGAAVRVRESAWQLGPSESALAAAWCTGWVSAAAEQSPELGPALEPYLRRRLREARAGALSVTVHHGDLLALPPSPSPATRRTAR